jgi:hypothetical protein
MGVNKITTQEQPKLPNALNVHLINSEKPIEQLQKDQELYKNYILSYKNESINDATTKKQRYANLMNDNGLSKSTNMNSILEKIVTKIRSNEIGNGEYIYNGYTFNINGSKITLISRPEPPHETYKGQRSSYTPTI